MTGSKVGMLEYIVQKTHDVSAATLPGAKLFYFLGAYHLLHTYATTWPGPTKPAQGAANFVVDIVEGVGYLPKLAVIGAYEAGAATFTHHQFSAKNIIAIDYLHPKMTPTTLSLPVLQSLPYVGEVRAQQATDYLNEHHIVPENFAVGLFFLLAATYWNKKITHHISPSSKGKLRFAKQEVPHS